MCFPLAKCHFAKEKDMRCGLCLLGRKGKLRASPILGEKKKKEAKFTSLDERVQAQYEKTNNSLR